MVKHTRKNSGLGLGSLHLVRLSDKRDKREDNILQKKVLQFEGLVPGGVEAALNSFGLLFALTSRIRDQFQLHIGV